MHILTDSGFSSSKIYQVFIRLDLKPHDTHRVIRPLFLKPACKERDANIVKVGNNE